MADSKQFGSPKVLQFGDKTGGNQPGDSGHCAQCEAMLADALDGTLSAADQELFDTHMAECGPCSQMLADARRGAALLEMLRTPAPEPPAALLERILAQTSGAAPGCSGMQPLDSRRGSADPASPALAPGYGSAAAYGNVVPFPAARGRGVPAQRVWPDCAAAAPGHDRRDGVLLHRADHEPYGYPSAGSACERLPTPQPEARLLRRQRAAWCSYYEGLRVVYELESRVHDLQTRTDRRATPAARASPQSASPAPQRQPGRPGPGGAP